MTPISDLIDWQANHNFDQGQEMKFFRPGYAITTKSQIQHKPKAANAVTIQA